MKRFSRSAVSGVTLLEIMLVLAIAAMIIVMSIRYYRSATTAQQASSTFQTIQAMIAAADNLGQSGSYTAASLQSISNIMNNGAATVPTPWGGTISVTPTATTVAFTVSSVPVGVCSNLEAALSANPKTSGSLSNDCSKIADFTFSYDTTK